MICCVSGSGAAVIHEELKAPSDLFFLMWFQAANPNQTVIPIGRDKHPRFVFKYLCSQLLSATDRQRYVKRVSFGIIHSSVRYLLKHCQHTHNRSFFFLFLLFYSNSELFPCDRHAGKSFFSDVYLLWCISKGIGEAAIIPSLIALAEGEFPMAPCRGAMSTVCLHTEWLPALCCRAQRISSSSLPKDHHGIWMSTRKYSLGVTITLQHYSHPFNFFTFSHVSAINFYVVSCDFICYVSTKYHSYNG